MRKSDVSYERGVTVVKPNSDCDFVEVDPAEFKELLEMVSVIEPPRLVVDLVHLDYCNNQFVSILIKVFLRLKERSGWRFGVCHVSEQVSDILEITRLNAVIDLHATRDEAIEAYATE